MFLPGYSVSSFHKISCDHSLLNGYSIYFTTALAAMSCVFTKYFDRYFYLWFIVISKEHLQSFIWVVPLLFQEVICSDLVFSRVLSFFEMSTCNRLCFQVELIRLQLQLSILRMTLFYYKRAVVATHSFKFTVFFSRTGVSRIFEVDSSRSTY